MTQPTPGSRATLAAVAAGLLVFLYLVRGMLLPFVASGVLAYVCTPLVDRMAARVRLPRWVFAVALVLAFAALAALLGWLAIPAMVRQSVRVAGDLEGSIQGFLEALIGARPVVLLGVPLDAASLARHAVGGLRTWLGEDAHLAEVAAYGAAVVFGTILAWALLGYFLIDAHRIAAGLWSLVPPGRRPFARAVWRELDPLLRRYFIGVALVVVYASFAAYAGLGLALGLHHAVFLAVLTGVLEVIPIVGPLAAAVIAGLVAVHHAATASDIVAYILYATALRISIDQLFGPIVLGRAARLRPATIIFCFLSGAVVYGIVGVVLAVPAALSIKVVLANLYAEPHTDSGSPRSA